MPNADGAALQRAPPMPCAHRRAAVAHIIHEYGKTSHFRNTNLWLNGGMRANATSSASAPSVLCNLSLTCFNVSVSDWACQPITILVPMAETPTSYWSALANT